LKFAEILPVLRQNISIRIPFFLFEFHLKIPFKFKGPSTPALPNSAWGIISATRLPAFPIENLAPEKDVGVPTQNLATEVFRCERVTLTLLSNGGSPLRVWRLQRLFALKTFI
jgi:hypothetical protein